MSINEYVDLVRERNTQEFLQGLECKDYDQESGRCLKTGRLCSHSVVQGIVPIKKCPIYVSRAMEEFEQVDRSGGWRE